MLRCSDGSLYTGYTINLERRIALHGEGKASKYTASRLPVEPVYSEEHETKSSAMKREAEIKKLSKEEKELLVRKRI